MGGGHGRLCLLYPVPGTESWGLGGVPGAARCPRLAVPAVPGLEEPGLPNSAPLGSWLFS